jgi:hypothetical protein
MWSFVIQIFRNGLLAISLDIHSSCFNSFNTYFLVFISCYDNKEGESKSIKFLVKGILSTTIVIFSVLTFMK